MLGSITFMAEFQLHLFALIAKPPWDSNLEPLKKETARDKSEGK